MYIFIHIIAAVTDAPSITYTNSLHSSMLVSLTGTIPTSSTINTSTPPTITTIITSTVTTATATGSGAVPVIAGAIGGIVLLIIIIIIILIVILVYTRRHSGKYQNNYV